MRDIFFVLGLLVAVSCSLSAQPKVACIYSKALDYVYKPDQTRILETLGWAEDLYENTQIEELVAKLGEYDMVVMNALFNYENSQDLSKYGQDFRKYLENGGCLVITDANYLPQTEWLGSIDKNLVWKPTNIVNVERVAMSVANRAHPLTAGEEPPVEGWTYPEPGTSQMIPLYINSKGFPEVVAMQIGKGTVVVASVYNQTGWPTKDFFTKLYSWNKGFTGSRVIAGDQIFKSRIEVGLPKDWYLGSNVVTVTLRKSSKKSGNAVLNLIDATTGKAVWSKDIEATSAAAVRVNYDIVLKNSVPVPVQFVLVDGKDDKLILASSSLVFAEAGPLLSLNMVMPIVRGTIQSKDPVRKLIVEGTAACERSDKLVLECIGVNADGKTMHKSQHKLESRNRFTVSTDVAKLPEGKYDFTFKLLRNGQAVTSQSMPLIIAPPAGTEVSFDDKHNCYVNGKPFFPIGLYHVSPAAFDNLNARSRAKGLAELDLFETIKKLKDMGFNTIHHTWGMPDEKYLDYTQSLGMWVVPEVAAPTREQVALANKYNNVLMWYGSDEPSGETLDIIKRARVQTAEYDPNRPVSAAVCNPALFRDALGGFDFVMMDPYLIRHAPLADIAVWIKKGFEASYGQKPVWLIPQAFTIDSAVWKEPTPEELKCQAYIGLVHGAKALFWYAFWTSEPWSDSPVDRGCWVLSDSKLWDAFPKLNAEVNELAPIIMFGKNKGAVKCTSKDVHTCLWEYKGRSYLIAVNTIYEPVKCTLGGIAGQADVMFENRAVSAGTGGLNESFKPLEVHVYRY